MSEVNDDDDLLDNTGNSVQCPYCGETVDITVDSGGGRLQQYVEDCAVCCQPWNVTVRFGNNGSASVHVSAQDE